ncbi:hypothetical protein [Pseudaquabacterium pictum]|uniref:Uncharacterized protein n=1 Tax=Pseudaquabacterium pictum TaxID=2315236 RepID=A0A480AM99_9BURK|nr:hypothetical protein [Rubrivivax pictus]GCL61497.1 hypothetical protein AQPW35_05780 [Rubrivivax pictus]
MAITTLDGALAGMRPPEFFAKGTSPTLAAGRPFSPFYLGGYPGAAVAPAPGIAGAALTSYAGQIPFPAASGNTHLARFSGACSSQSGMLLLCDRLWHNSGISVTTTTAQTVNSVAWPARDKNGAIDGDGVLIGLEISAATGVGAATPSISYTNSAGVSGKTSTTVDAYAASSALGMFYRLGLQAGDVGVQSIQSVTLGVSMTSGSVSLVAYRVLAALELSASGVPNAVDALTAGLPRLYDNTVPFLLFIPQTTAAGQITGSLVYTQG